ncbi:MAG TPA: hypothetical protein VJ521_10985 [Acidobacteriota bacterium]|nr:hypothetical protein [Acidobacteriota bacterium]
MEFEQIIKRLDWFEKERNKDKEIIISYKEQIASLEISLKAANQQIKALSKKVEDLTVATNAARFDQFDVMLAKQRADLNKIIDENEKRSQRREKEAVRRHQLQLEEISKSVADLKKTFTPGEYDKKFKERADELHRVYTSISELEKRIDEAVDANQGIHLSIRALEEARRTDLKRVADIQGEITAVRKRAEDGREKIKVTADSIRNMDMRINELLTSEFERKQAQTAFIEQQSLSQIDRERIWKEWLGKVETFQKEASGIDSQVQVLDDALRGAKKAQETYLELNTKLERRIGEITEMQRLAEERLRQEWVSFKADDQKRWTGYSLSSEEAFRDIRKDSNKYESRIKPLEDIVQVLQDQIHQITDTTEQQLQELMNVTHEWMTSYERIMGHNKKVKK